MKGKIDKLYIKNRDCYVYTPPFYDSDNEKTYPVIYCNDGDIMMNCFNEIADELEQYYIENTSYASVIVMIPPLDRNKEYTPWKSVNPFNHEEFYGCADKYIEYVVNDVTAHINTAYRTKKEREYNSILGYSLGGLVSLYTMYKSSCFMKAACISSSLWYENWHDFVRDNNLKNNNCDIYLYLGKNESKSRNKVLRTVQIRTEETYEMLKNQIGDRVSFTLNEGGHFDNVEQRYYIALTKLTDT